MKKILFLLLSTVAMYGQVPADATPLENIQITNNKTSTTATKVNVQENDGTINTKPLSELANYLEFASAVNLPVTGEQGKLYLTKDNNRLYRFNGTIYQEISADETTATIQAKRPLKTIENQSLEGSGNIDLSKSDVGLGNVDNTSDANKPISTATQTVLDLKANLASPALTGTPTAPTPTTTTGIANKSYVDGLNSGNVKLTGNQTISGQKSFSLTGKIDMQTNNTFPAISVTALGSNGLTAAEFINNSSFPNSSALRLQTGLSGGVGNVTLDVLNSSSIGTGIVSNASNGGVSISSQSGDGDSYISNITFGGTGRNYVGRNNGTETYSVDKIGNVIGNSYIKRSAPTTNILLAGGGDIAQNTAFNKNFGTTAGTIAEGNDSRILNGKTAFGWGNHAGLYPTLTGTGATGTWGINISGNAASATSWGGLAQFQDTDNGNSNYIMVTVGGTGVWKYRGINTFKTDLGLGSNAYTSTAYLPLSGGTISGNVNVTGTVTASGGFFNSDRRLKNIFKRDGDVAYYTWKDGRDNKTHIGYIAQEVQENHPNQVQADDKGILSVNYVEILVEKIRVLEKRIEQLEKIN